MSELAGVSVREAVVLVEGQFLVGEETIDMSIGALIELAEVAVEFLNLHVDFALNASRNHSDGC